MAERSQIAGTKPDRSYQRANTEKLIYKFPGTASGGNHSYFPKGVRISRYKGPESNKGLKGVPQSVLDFAEDAVLNNPIFKEATKLGMVGDDPMKTAYFYATRSVQGTTRKVIDPTNNLRRLEEKVNTAKLKSAQEEEKRALTQEIMESERRVTTRRRNPRSLLAQLPETLGNTLGSGQTLGV